MLQSLTVAGIDKGIWSKRDSHTVLKGILIRAWENFRMTVSVRWPYRAVHNKPRLLGLQAKEQPRAGAESSPS